MLCSTFYSILCSPMCVSCSALRAEEKRSYGVVETPATDSVNLKLKHLGSRKLLLHWVGLFVVELRIGSVAYFLALTDAMCIVT